MSLYQLARIAKTRPRNARCQRIHGAVEHGEQPQRLGSRPCCPSVQRLPRIWTKETARARGDRGDMARRRANLSHNAIAFPIQCISTIMHFCITCKVQFSALPRPRHFTFGPYCPPSLSCHCRCSFAAADLLFSPCDKSFSVSAPRRGRHLPNNSCSFVRLSLPSSSSPLPLDLPRRGTCPFVGRPPASPFPVTLQPWLWRPSPAR